MAVRQTDIERLLEPPVPVPERMTWEQFLNWDTEVYAEWVDGVIMQLNTPGDEHQQFVSFFDIIMNLYALKTGAGTVRVAPFLVRLKNSGRHPDVMFIATKHLDRIQPKFVEGGPDIVVEIISASTRESDEGVKFREYEEAGVGEYWQIDYERRQARSYRLDGEGRFQEVLLAEGVFASEALPGFRLSVAWLWDDPLSRVPEVLRTLGAV
jgi:Uma2 family endonuclease